jgi:Dual specificity phosphatase, catalytic domain
MSARATPKRSKKPAPRTSPSEIAPGVFVGGWSDALGFSGTKFCVLDEAPPDMPPATHVAIYDGEKEQPIVENLDRLAGLVGAARSRNEPVLIFCGHGIRRSPLAGAWYLHRSEAIDLDAAFDRIASVRPHVEPVRKWSKGWRALETGAAPRARGSGSN